MVLYNAGSFVSTFLNPSELNKLWGIIETGVNAKGLTKAEKAGSLCSRR